MAFGTVYTLSFLPSIGLTLQEESASFPIAKVLLCKNSACNTRYIPRCPSTSDPPPVPNRLPLDCPPGHNPVFGLQLHMIAYGSDPVADGCSGEGLKMAVIARTVKNWVINSENGSGKSLRQSHPLLRECF